MEDSKASNGNTYMVVRTVHDVCQREPKQPTPHWLRRGTFLVKPFLTLAEAESLAGQMQDAHNRAAFFRFVSYEAVPMDHLLDDPDRLDSWQGSNPDTCPDPVD